MSGALARAVAFAPGSIGNVGPGLDVLGLAVAGRGDTVTACRTATPGVRIDDPGHPALDADADRHACGLAAAWVLRLAGDRTTGMALSVAKGLPLSGGQGGSAASAVAAAVAANALLGGPLGPAAVLQAALEAEAVVAGRHADNVAPSLLGGLVVVRALDPLDVVRVEPPAGLRLVLAHPDQQLRTRDGRRVLPATVPLATALHAAAQTAAVVAACAAGDLALLGRAIDDRIAEPARAPLLPGFAAAKGAALAAGALGASISGSGPTAFALCADDAVAGRVAAAMQAAYAAVGVGCATRVAAPDLAGAVVREAA